MCFTQSNLIGMSRWNWDGDEIIHDSSVPSSRTVAGSNSKKDYEIDVREFLVSENNSVMQHTIRHEMGNYVKSISGDWSLFQSRASRSFDYRARIITSYVSEKVGYQSKPGKDPWLFPDETLFCKKGDCEDRAFLIASLLIASGISPYNVRVALGKLNLHSAKGQRSFDHVWVMYKAESGHWLLLEPLNVRLKGKKGETPGTTKSTPSKKAEYIPYFLFNNSHLWGVHHLNDRLTFSDSVSRRKQWTKFNPKFAGDVHQTILNAALNGAEKRIIDDLNRRFSRAVLGLVGPMVDEIDRDISHYSPIHHFDNCFIKEGWDFVEDQLSSFKLDNNDLDSFARAAHAIADFYAHSSYVHFAAIRQCANTKDDYAMLYDATQNPGADYSFQSQFDLESGKFSVNKKYWKQPINQIPALWKNKIISGRYAQREDNHGEDVFDVIIEGKTYIPEELEEREDFCKRGSVPHHNEIAVDSEKIGSNKLYSKSTTDRMDPKSYSNQFKWRKNSAIRHIRQAFSDSATKLPHLPG